MKKNLKMVTNGTIFNLKFTSNTTATLQTESKIHQPSSNELHQTSPNSLPDSKTVCDFKYSFKYGSFWM